MEHKDGCFRGWCLWCAGHELGMGTLPETQVQSGGMRCHGILSVDVIPKHKHTTPSCIHTHIYPGTDIHGHTHTPMHMPILTCSHSHTHTHPHAHRCMYMDTQIFTCTHSHAHTCIWTHKYTHEQIDILNAHTPKRPHVFTCTHKYSHAHILTAHTPMHTNAFMSTGTHTHTHSHGYT